MRLNMLVKKIIGKPITMLILFSLLIMLSIYTFSRLKIELMPRIEENDITVSTQYAGRSAKEVEEKVTSILEGSLSLVKNIKTITSKSFKGNSIVDLRFYHGTNLDLALNEIRDALELSKNLLPQEVSLYRIYRGRSGNASVLSFVMYADRPVLELKRYADNILKPKLERLNGVGRVQVIGGGDKHILIEVSQNRLEAYGLTLSEIVPFISSQNVEFSVGNMLDSDLEYQIQVSGEFHSIKDLEDVVIAYKKPSTYSLGNNSMVQVRLRDIASVRSAFQDLQDYAYYNDKPSIVISVQKQSGANSVIVADAVSAEIEKIKLALPKDISLDIAYDNAKHIKKAISSVADSAYSGAILALCIILFFLRSFRATVIIGITIPLAIVLTFCLMYFADISLNIMSLSGLALSVGMLVDCSIVVIENIYKYRQKGAKLISSAILGTQEMLMPIMAATLTSICVFAPMLIFKAELDIIGDYVRDFAFTIVISLTASLFVAVFLVPVLSSYYVGLYTTFQKPIKNKLIKRIDNFLYGIYSVGEHFYVKLLNYVLIRKLAFLLVVMFSFILSLILFPFLNVSLFPYDHSSLMHFDFNFPHKTSLENSKFYSDKILEILKSEIKVYKSIVSKINSSGFAFEVTLPFKEEASGEFVGDEEDIRYRVYKRVESLYPNFNSNAFSEGNSFGAPIEIKITASDFEYAREYGELLISLLKKKFPNLVSPRLNIQEELQIDIEIDREKAYSYGINMETLSREIRANIDGISAGKYIENGVSYDILLRINRSNIASLKDLDKIFIVNAFGVKIPLSVIAKLKKTKGISEISREDQSLVVKLTAGIAPGENLALVTANVVDFVTNKVPRKDGVLVKFEGEYSEFTSSMQQFMVIICMAILLVFGVMAAQFESLLKPFIILFTIPLTLIGVVPFYFISGEKISVFTAIGMLMLVGVVVNTGIVLVDYINLLLKRGFNLEDAVLEAGRSRFRPILMSALTSIIGLFPLAFSGSSGNSLIKPIAFTFIGGMVASTFLTLLFIPIIFEIFYKLSIKDFILFKSWGSVDKIDVKGGSEGFANRNANNTDILKSNAKGNSKADANSDDVFIDED
ncbi:efflux RND transporter permease subunit [Borrelia hermsii DAH]|uniref:Acriflavin resistance plasma membrane protein n=3 Tax=Borrelia hermsii TaxID=140 RepID=A0AA34WD81_BORHD|nr:efflux RND transporter permease subunit [Borrelia hermsii]AAX16661.1 acriflavin resistance plasma membrane protein [Borrelia hermsii DAH]UPA07492.1 efflux RND transporter permease subunit [Borrelia hermsii DAH]